MGLGEEFAHHAALDTILQELRRFPGEGWQLIRAGLHTLPSALKVEPDDEVRKLIEEVLGGGVVESPGGPE